MIAFFDVDYKNDKAQVAGIIVREWLASDPVKIYTKIISGIAPYEPGAFYKRELPCILSLLSDIEELITCYVIDGYVWLGDKPGLGYYLYQARQALVPVVGIAKSRFHHNHKAVEVIRGNSNSPLFVTSIGLAVETSAQYVRQMQGENRLPSLVKLTDQVCRQWEK